MISFSNAPSRQPIVDRLTEFALGQDGAQREAIGDGFQSTVDQATLRRPDGFAQGRPGLVFAPPAGEASLFSLAPRRWGTPP
jgi:hypothetical protein